MIDVRGQLVRADPVALLNRGPHAQIENLTKIYSPGVLALNNVSFEVPKGQFLQ
jgi:hypothetical protein